MTDSSIHEQAMLLTSIVAMANQAGLQRGYEVLIAYDEPPSRKQFEAEHPVGSEANRGVNALLNLGETVGTYIKHGALSADLVNDLLWLEGMWTWVENYVKDIREQFDEDALYENFEAAVRKS